MRIEEIALRAIDEREARDTCCSLVGARETTVDREHLAVALHGVFPILHLHGHVTTHDVRGLRVEPKVFEDAIEDGLLIEQGIEGILHLFARGLVGHQIDLERGHLALREERRTGAEPHVPNEVLAAFAQFRVGAIERIAYVLVEDIEERATLVDGAEHINFLERAIGVQRHAGVEEQVAIINSVETAHVEHEVHVALELFATDERLRERFHDRLFFGRELVGIGPIDRGEHGVGDGVFNAANFDGASRGIAVRIELGAELDGVKLLAIFEAEGRILVDELGFHLELQDGHGLLDLHVQTVLFRREARIALQRVAHAGVFGISGLRERCERSQVDAVGIFQDGEVAIARAVAHHVRDAAPLA